MTDFGEVVDLTANIESILKRYPFSIGIFREILQNSDDAKAQRQVFIFDKRTHPSARLVDSSFEALQGPALLAFNDATFHDDDWTALQNISRSSKKIDTAKIGKYGIGIRSCYHLTDNLEVLSGESLVIFDPHQRMLRSGGKKWSLGQLAQHHPDQLTPFRSCLPSEEVLSHFQGTVIRLPLRRDGNDGQISTKVPSEAEIESLMTKFVTEELAIVMLFLTNITHIELRVIGVDGTTRIIGEADVKREPPVTDICRQSGSNIPVQSFIATITVRLQDDDRTIRTEIQRWRIVHASFPQELCVSVLRGQLHLDAADDYDVLSDVKNEKLCPAEGSPVALAIPVDPLPLVTRKGRLFTYLPLPLSTGFPCHIHALFALTDSRDHLRNAGEVILDRTPDKLVVEWNRVLFDKFVPMVWGYLLHDLVTHKDISDIDCAWPFQGSLTHPVESTYWGGILQHIVKFVVQNQLPVWPLVSYSEQATITHDNILTTLMASTSIDHHILAALAMAGLRITLPPAPVHLLLTNEDVPHLTPDSAYRQLSDLASQLESLSAKTKELIIRYLVGPSGSWQLLARLSLFSTISGEAVSLQSRHNGSCVDSRTLLDEQQESLFGSFDSEAISLRSMPADIANGLVNHGSVDLNVHCLDVAKAVQYVRLYLDCAGSTGEDGHLAWLLDFWKWLPSWDLADQAFADIKALRLLPTNTDLIKTIQDGAFVRGSLDYFITMLLGKIGLSFLHADFPTSARNYLHHHGATLSATSAVDILNYIDPALLNGLRLNDKEILYLREHFSQCLSKTGRLTTEQKTRLRSLPVYHLYSVSDTETSVFVEARIAAIEPKATIHCVAKPVLLPKVPDTAFLALSNDTRTLLEYVDLRSAARQLDDSDIIAIAVNHFADQSRALQCAFLDHISRRPQPFDIISKLKETPFVIVGPTTRAPQYLIDPFSPVASLVLPEERRVPLSDDEMLGPMRSLGLLSTDLTRSLVLDRITFISSLRSAGREHDAIALASPLLNLLQSTSFIGGLQIPPKANWLPVGSPPRLYNIEACRDQRESKLFDRVLPVVSIHLQSLDLRRAFGWHHPISLEILKEQFKRITLEEGKFDHLFELIQEFGRRQEELKRRPEFMRELQEFVLDPLRPWIPISNDPLCIVTSLEVMFHTEELPGFHRIPFDLTRSPRVKEFMRGLGCQDGPSVVAISYQLKNLHTEAPLSPRLLRKAVRLLDALADLGIATSQDDGTNLFVPDVQNVMRRVSQVYYDDLGPRAHYVELPENHFKLHIDITARLATRLGVATLSSLHLQELDPDDEEMHEDPTSRIYGVLRSYSIEQALGEFLANAADAGATEFNIVMNDPITIKHGWNFISQRIAILQSEPSFIIHNNALFEEKDFEGIRRIGLGGKRDSEGVIGRFGLGALTMFHFSEMAMIISGGFVLLLDPGKSHLPSVDGRRRNALKIPFKKFNSLYNGHVSALEGIFGLSANADCYEGTLFWLPLRNKQEAAKSKMARHPVSAQEIRRLTEAFQISASQSLLFIDLRMIATWLRRSSGSPLVQKWSVHASREAKTALGDDTRYDIVTINSIEPIGKSRSKIWHVVSSRYQLDGLHGAGASFDTNLLDKHRLKELDAGLAYSSSTKSQDSRFFSKLPLPVTTSLPLHIHASFILADDRRSIRYDAGGQMIPEVQCNHWILSHLLPLLYCHLLELLPGADSLSAWPASTHDDEDPLSRTVIDSFYQNLMSSTKRVCCSVTGERLVPQESVFLHPDISKDINDVLTKMKPSELILLPAHVCRRADRANAPALPWIDPPALRDIFLRYRQSLLDAHRRSPNQITTKHLNNIIRYLSPDPKSEDQATLLHSLPLLQLADGTLADIESSSGTTRYGYVHDQHKQWVPWPLFPPAYFVDSGMDLQGLFQRPINVVPLSGENIRELISTRLPNAKATIRETTTPEEIWISEFWSHFSMLGAGVEAIKPIALVPTCTAGRYVSIDHVQSTGVLASPPKNLENKYHLTESLCKMGAIILQRSEDLPRSLHALRNALNDQTFTFDEVVRFLKNRASDFGGSPADLLGTISGPRHADFAAWMRREINDLSLKVVSDASSRRFLNDMKSFIRDLPIWRARCPHTTRICPLSDVDVDIIPDPFGYTDISPFLPASHYFMEDRVPLAILEKLDRKPMSLATLLARMAHRTMLESTEELQSYRQVIGKILLLNPLDHGIGQLRVPNRCQVLVSSGMLYSDNEPIFRTVFAHRPDLLLHDQFQVYDTSLRRCGLRHSRDFAAFLQCAQTIHEDTRSTDSSVQADVLQRATILFGWYEELPMHIGSNGGQWAQLNNLRFIPRDPIRRRYRDSSIDATFYASNLETIVSPSQILRREYEAVGWSQRGLFFITPHDRLLLADLSLGLPTAEQVVEHLRVLSLRVARTFSGHTELEEDLRKTYKWLDEHSDDAGTYLLRRTKEPLFLNIDLNRSGIWSVDDFACASQLIFNAPDEDNRKGVREFLLPYKSLLLASNALEIKQATVPLIEQSPADDVLFSLRRAMDEQRSKRLLTDAVFVTSTNLEFPVHRSFLAATNEYFRDLFCGALSESDAAASAENPTRIYLGEEDHTEAIRCVLDYLYTGVVNVVDQYDQQELLSVLRLSHRWRMDDLMVEIQALIVRALTPNTYSLLRETAEELGAQILLDGCDEYARDNNAALRRLGILL